MRQGIARAAAIAALAVVPAVALASSTTYEGKANGDPQAKIKLKISDGQDREVKNVVARKLKYLSSAVNCTETGRTARIVVKDRWRVKGNGDFRVVGSFDGGSDPVGGGQLNVVGTATPSKVTGTVKFTYGKTGCQTEKVEFKATK